MLRIDIETTFMWSIWYKMVAVYEWRTHIALASISKQCVFASRTLASQLNISFGIVYKLEGCGVGQFTSYMNFVGCGPANYDNFN